MWQKFFAAIQVHLISATDVVYIGYKSKTQLSTKRCISVYGSNEIPHSWKKWEKGELQAYWVCNGVSIFFIFLLFSYHSSPSAYVCLLTQHRIYNTTNLNDKGIDRVYDVLYLEKKNCQNFNGQLLYKSFQALAKDMRYTKKIEKEALVQRKWLSEQENKAMERPSAARCTGMLVLSLPGCCWSNSHWEF